MAVPGPAFKARSADMNTIFSQWTLMRLLRLMTGAMVLGQGLWTREWLFAGVGGYLFVMSLLNLGGCSSGVCGMKPFQAPPKPLSDEVQFEEVKS
jgi:hypothetical protein